MAFTLEFVLSSSANWAPPAVILRIRAFWQLLCLNKGLILSFNSKSVSPINYWLCSPPVSHVQGWRYLLGQRFSAMFCFGICTVLLGEIWKPQLRLSWKLWVEAFLRIIQSLIMVQAWRFRFENKNLKSYGRPSCSSMSLIIVKWRLDSTTVTNLPQSTQVKNLRGEHTWVIFHLQEGVVAQLINNLPQERIAELTGMFWSTDLLHIFSNTNTLRVV